MRRPELRLPPLRQVLWVALVFSGGGLLTHALPWLLDVAALVVAIGCVLGLLVTEPQTDGWV